MVTTTAAKKKPASAPAKKAAAAPVKASTPVKATKPVKTVAPAPSKTVPQSVAKSSKKKDKPEKVKVVRDSFTIPKAEYAQLAAMKKRAMDLGLEAKKSELIRAGLTLLSGTADAAFRKALGNVPTLKTGRPGKA